MPDAHPDERTVPDNRLALGQLVIRCEHAHVGWTLSYDVDRLRYELRVFDGLARGTYRGDTASHAASKVLAALDEHRIGWES